MNTTSDQWKARAEQYKRLQEYAEKMASGAAPVERFDLEKEVLALDPTNPAWVNFFQITFIKNLNGHHSSKEPIITMDSFYENNWNWISDDGTTIKAPTTWKELLVCLTMVLSTELVKIEGYEDDTNFNEWLQAKVEAIHVTDPNPRGALIGILTTCIRNHRYLYDLWPCLVPSLNILLSYLDVEEVKHEIGELLMKPLYPNEKSTYEDNFLGNVPAGFILEWLNEKTDIKKIDVFKNVDWEKISGMETIEDDGDDIMYLPFIADDPACQLIRLRLIKGNTPCLQ